MMTADVRNLVLGALRERLLGEASLSALNLEVQAGWRGDESTSAATRPVLVIEAGAGGTREETDPQIVAVRQETGAMAPVAAGDGVAHGEGIDQVNATALVDYGEEEIPIDCTLIVTDRQRGKSRRAEILRALDGVFGYAPGESRQITLELDNELRPELELGVPGGTFARVFPPDDGVRMEDTAEGQKRNEWLARWTWTCQAALEASSAVTLNTRLAIQPEYDGTRYPEFDAEGFN